MNLEDSGMDKEGKKKTKNKTGDRMSGRSIEKEFLGVILNIYIY